jgi:1-acyl-sn-glycerol-3-phosphate acyltransferase
VGRERLPEGGVLLAPNHPNALVDPLVVLGLSPRPVSFMAKAPLFTTFMVKHFIKALDSLPVYRAQDGFDTSKNKDTLLAAREVLDRGGAICIFPEGKSHDEPALEKLKTGPARIALGARASGASVHVVPCGIFYADKGIFRSDISIVFGEPIEVERHELDADGEPPFDAAKALTIELRDGLDEILVQGESHDLLTLVGRATQLVRGAEHDMRHEADGDAGRVERDRQLRQLILEGHEHWKSRDPQRVHALATRVEVLDELFSEHGMHASKARSHEGSRRWALGLAKMALLSLSAPLAMIGIVAHWIPYRAIAWMARFMSKGAADVVSTMKILAAMLFFPAWWIIAASGAFLSAGLDAALIAALTLPTLAALALYWLEGVKRWRAWARGVTLRFQNADVHAFMLEERQGIYDELVAMAQLIEDQPASS